MRMRISSVAMTIVLKSHIFLMMMISGTAITVDIAQSVKNSI